MLRSANTSKGIKLGWNLGVIDSLTTINTETKHLFKFQLQQLWFYSAVILKLKIRNNLSLVLQTSWKCYYLLNSPSSSPNQCLQRDFLLLYLMIGKLMGEWIITGKATFEQCWGVPALSRELEANLGEIWVSFLNYQHNTQTKHLFKFHLQQLQFHSAVILKLQIWNNLSLVLQTSWEFHHWTVQIILPAEIFCCFMIEKLMGEWIITEYGSIFTFYFPLSSPQCKRNMQPLFGIISRGLLGEFGDFHVALSFDQDFPALPPSNSGHLD